MSDVAMAAMIDAIVAEWEEETGVSLAFQRPTAVFQGHPAARESLVEYLAKRLKGKNCVPNTMIALEAVG